MENSGSLICREEPKRVEEGQPVVEAGRQPVVESGRQPVVGAGRQSEVEAASSGSSSFLLKRSLLLLLLLLLVVLHILELKELPCPLFYFVPAALLDWLLHACVPVVPPKEEEGPGSQHHPNLIELLFRVLLLDHDDPS